MKVYDVKCADGVVLRVTHYGQQNKKGKGPLLMIHGMGVSHRIFLVDTIEESMAEHFFAHGYDIFKLKKKIKIFI